MSGTSSLSDLAAEAIAVLASTQWAITDAADHVPARQGLYAIYGDVQAHRELGLPDDPQARSAPNLPLYIGKAEVSFVSRDLKDHFAAVPGSEARTGNSTVRRSFAALLRHSLDLHGVPRNVAKPAHFSMYSLAGAGDARLSTWMQERLTFSVWAAPTGRQIELVNVETELIRHFLPPLNIRSNPRKHKRLGIERKVAAAEAKAWRSEPEQKSADQDPIA